MERTDPKLTHLLQRTPLSYPIVEFFKAVEKDFSALGQINSHEPLIEGYEDANIKLQTNKGAFVLKIFSKEKHEENCQSYVKILRQAHNVGVPVTHLISGKKGDVGTYAGGNSIVYYIITKFFEGANFEKNTPSREDIQVLTHYLARLNTLSFPVSESYDSWGNKNLIKEYVRNKNKLAEKEFKLIEPTVKRLTQLDFARFSVSVIHADMQRRHVLKNKQGEYCLLDFGCARFDARVLELSTFLAWFCLGVDTWSDRDEIVDLVVNTYSNTHTLSDYEIKSLPVLTLAAYTSYFLKNSLLRKAGDQSREIIDWFNLSKELLLRCLNWKWTLNS